MKQQYDIVVVGAGPAGCTAARKAAEAGLDVLLIEKRHEIGAPLRCAEAIGERLSAPYIQPDEKWIDARITSYAVVNRVGERVTVPPAEPTLVVNRKVFDVQLALMAARAGAELRAASAAVGLLMQGGQVAGVRVRSFGQDFEISARLVVAADGTESQTARWAGLKTTPPREDYFTALEYFLAGVGGRIDPQTCQYHLDAALAPGGYLWIFPKGPDCANVGLVVSADRARGVHLRQNLDRFIDSQFASSSVISVVAGGIPVSGMLKQPGCSGLLVVGDAAHQADPLSGGGINWSMLGADLAVQAAVEALKKGDVSWKRLQVYERLWRERCGKMHAALYKIRKMITSMDPDRVDRLVHNASQLPVERMSLGEVALQLLRHDPLLLVEARALISSGLIVK